MPYFDGNISAEEIIDRKYDFTIIGAGAAGILLAVKFAKKNKKALLIETGRFSEEQKYQELNNVIQTGKTLRNAVWGRKRAIGGSTIAWGGQSLPFTEHDFKRKKWVELSGWPIEKSALKNFYNEANDFMGIDLMDYKNDVFSILKKQPLPLQDKNIVEHFSKWSNAPNFRKKNSKKLSKDIDVLYNVTASDFEFENATIKQLKVKNFNNEEYVLKVNTLIIAAGTIESVRLLLLNSQNKNLNSTIQSDWLGKCFMDHPCIEIGKIKTKSPYQLQKRFNTQYINRKKYSVRFSLSEGLIYSKELLSASASIMFNYRNPSENPFIKLKAALKSKNILKIMSLLKDFNTYFKSGKALLFDKFIYKSNADAIVAVMAEQEPVKNSYLKLSKEKDKFGLEKIELNWDITNKTWKSIVELSKSLNKEFSKWSLGELEVYPHINLGNSEWKSYFTDVNHHMGGCRMSLNKENGVVDSNLKVWGVDNLYVTSCAVFPTSSHSNPTLTLLALACRLVKKLI